MSTHSVFIALFVFGLAMPAVFCMQPNGDQPNKRLKLDNDQEESINNNNNNNTIDDDVREIRRKRYQQHRANEMQKQQEELTHKQEELAHQEKARREAQEKELQTLAQQQFEFDALEELAVLLTAQIDELEYAQDFDTLCDLLSSITDTLGESNLSFTELAASDNEVLVSKVREIYKCLVGIVSKIEANPIAQKACLKLQTINNQLQIICQIVGYQGGIEIQIQDMYIDEDEAIAFQEQQEIEKNRVAGDEDLARFLQDGHDQQDLHDDEAEARRLQEAFDRGEDN